MEKLEEIEFLQFPNASIPQFLNQTHVNIEWTHKRKNSHYISMIR
ncbi:hypothetical protein D1AOALGA4SA_12706 [Olavius algarvensis Delta 1 endosymbiont]|nr:hypothetical protein D1AOALGA4SA_12706 [Olavius algarvensis Delta 1 endosymbiont]